MVGAPRRGDRHRTRIANQWRTTAARSASGPYQILRTNGAQLRPAHAPKKLCFGGQIRRKPNPKGAQASARAGPTNFAQRAHPLIVHVTKMVGSPRRGDRRRTRIANQWRTTAARSASGPYHQRAIRKPSAGLTKFTNVSPRLCNVLHLPSPFAFRLSPSSPFAFRLSPLAFLWYNYDRFQHPVPQSGETWKIRKN